MKSLKKINAIDIVIILIGIILAIAIRYSLLGFKSDDFFKFTKIWYNTVKLEGFSAFRNKFFDYNPPYVYLLYLVARFIPISSIVTATKLPSMVADFISAWIAFRIVRLKYVDSQIPLVAGFAILFAPTVVLNSAFWGQMDALYTCAMLATLYFVLIKKFALAMLMFGLSVSIKAQAVFIFPLLFALLIKKEIPWKYYLLIPLVMFLALVPAWIAGRPLPDLLLIYPSQAGEYKQLTMNAPSVFSLIPVSGDFYIYYYYAALVSAVAAGLLISIFIYKSQNMLTSPIILEMALISVLMMPYILPKMHERNFYPADVISILFAFYFPRYFFIPLLMTGISFFSYQIALFGEAPVPLSLLGLCVLIMIIILSRDAIIQLFPPMPKSETSQTQ